MTINFKGFLAVAIFLILIALKPCYAWEGYDYTSKSSIEIESGNLVREGLVIQFYDNADGLYHTGKVVLLDESFHGTSLTIQDFNQGKTRILKMNE